MAGLLDGQPYGAGLLGNFQRGLAQIARQDPDEMIMRQRRQQVLSGLGQGASLGDAATKLFQIGDLEGALAITRLHEAQSQRALTQSNADRSHALERDKFDFMKTHRDVPSGFRTSATGLEPVPGGPADPKYKREVGDRQNAPPGYLWNDPSDQSKGMRAIPGGPGEKVDAEVAGRLGLAKSFLGQLPDIKSRIKAGEITGLFDAAQAKFGMGKPGELRRQMDSGAEALLRMLTGAGMNKTEAEEYTRRYKFHPTDNAETALSKMDQLERELLSVGETVGKGRGGFEPPKPSAVKPPTGTIRVRSIEEARKLPKGTRFIDPNGVERTVP